MEPPQRPPTEHYPKSFASSSNPCKLFPFFEIDFNIVHHWCIFTVALGRDYVSVKLRPLTGPLSIPQMIPE
jgi:hypothetical protein